MRGCSLLVAMVFVFFQLQALASDELLTAVLTEQQAFKSGDCDTVIAMMASDITFYANTRKMSREQVDDFCRKIKRPFGAGRDPISDTVTPHLVQPGLGYTVRDFSWHDADGAVVNEVVTKLCSKASGRWQIIHFQSTVLPQSPAK